MKTKLLALALVFLGLEALPAADASGDGFITVNTGGAGRESIGLKQDSLGILTEMDLTWHGFAPSHHYALLGEVRWKEVKGGGYIEAKGSYPDWLGGDPIQFCSTRALEADGQPLPPMEGESDWVPFMVPYEHTEILDRSDITNAKNAHWDVTVNLPGAGLAFVRNLRTVQCDQASWWPDSPLPKEVHTTTIEAEVFRDGSVHWFKTTFSMEEFGALLVRNEDSKRPIILRYRKDVPDAVVMRVAQVLAKYGADRVSVVKSNEPPDKKAQSIPSTSGTAWWGEEVAGWFGGLAGGVLALLGALLRVLSLRGGGLKWQEWGSWGFFAVGVLFLWGSVAAVFLRQPYHVVFPLVLFGAILIPLCGLNIRIFQGRFHERELRRIASRDV